MHTSAKQKMKLTILRCVLLGCARTSCFSHAFACVCSHLHVWCRCDLLRVRRQQLLVLSLCLQSRVGLGRVWISKFVLFGDEYIELRVIFVLLTDVHIQWRLINAG